MQSNISFSNALLVAFYKTNLFKAALKHQAIATGFDSKDHKKNTHP
ncbi:MAG: hypothetical protein AAGM46_07410 [Cyanobacteria bacterium J06582_2]